VKLRVAAAIALLTWVFWQLPLAKTRQIRIAELIALADFKSAPQQGATALTFFRETSAGQYTALGISPTGQIVKAISLPGETLTKADGSTISLANKTGYMSAPDNGAFYVWYPQIGQQIFVFNEQGNFLWEKDESHYLHVLPRGRYIMAAAGDHSRLTFMNPDFKAQADFQGVLFTQHIADDAPDLKSAQVCLGSLDGDIIIAHLDRKESMRKKLGYALKSLTCNFTEGTLAAIIEKKVEIDKVETQRDFLLHAKFDLQKKDLDITTKSELAMRTTTASPLVLTHELTCFIQKNSAGESAIYLAEHDSSKLQEHALTNAKDFLPDEWRAVAQRLTDEDACVFAHKSGRLIYANARGILLDRSDIAAERVRTAEGGVYIQTAAGILSFR